MSVPLVIAVVGLATFGLRASMLLAPRAAGRPRADRVLRRVPAAVLPVLAVSTLLPAIEVDPTRLVAVAVATLVAWRTRNLGAILGAGMTTQWLVSALT